MENKWIKLIPKPKMRDEWKPLKEMNKTVRKTCPSNPPFFLLQGRLLQGERSDLLRKNLIGFAGFPFATHLRKGGNPHNRMYVITPAAQISTFRPYLRKQGCVTCAELTKKKVIPIKNKWHWQDYVRIWVTYCWCGNLYLSVFFFTPLQSLGNHDSMIFFSSTISPKTLQGLLNILKSKSVSRFPNPESLIIKDKDVPSQSLQWREK